MKKSSHLTTDELWDQLEKAIDMAIDSRVHWKTAKPGSRDEDFAGSMAFKLKCKAHVALIHLIDGTTASEIAGDHDNSKSEVEVLGDPAPKADNKKV